jgi:hypothetical protein
MSKVTIVYYGFVIPKNKCLKKQKTRTSESEDTNQKSIKAIAGENVFPRSRDNAILGINLLFSFIDQIIEKL